MFFPIRLLWEQSIQKLTLVPAQISLQILMGIVTIFSDRKEHLDLNLNRSVWTHYNMEVFTPSDLCVLCFKFLRFVFRVGPLHSDTKYSVGAEKEGYILTASTTHQGSFKAFKLGEIIVKVRYSGCDYVVRSFWRILPQPHPAGLVCVRH